MLAHDARTLELAEYHESPFRAIPADPAQADPARLAAESDWSGLHSGHRARWATFAATWPSTGCDTPTATSAIGAPRSTLGWPAGTSRHRCAR